jgi:hypothetical protein
MAILQSTSPLDDSVRTLYAAEYAEGAKYARLYEQLAVPISTYGVEKAARLGNTLTVNFLSDVIRGTSVIPENTDVVPTSRADATATLTPTSRWVSEQWSEEMDIDQYTDFAARRYRMMGEAMAETIDVLARDAALQGSQINRATTRVLLTAATTATHLWSSAAIEEANSTLETMLVAPFMGNGRAQYFAIAHPEIFYDLRNQDSNITSIAQYQMSEIIMRYELAQVGPFKLIISPFAKVFIGQGVACGTAVNTTLASASSALDKTFVASASTNMGSGYKWLNIIDTAETSNTHVNTNERVKYVSSSTVTQTIVGSGANGGLKYPHAAGATVNNTQSVFTVAYGGPASIAKAFDPVTGEFGTLVGPKVTGLLDQFISISAKWYGGYGILNQAHMLRGEYASSLESA